MSILQSIHHSSSPLELKDKSLGEVTVDALFNLLPPEVPAPFSPTSSDQSPKPIDDLTSMKELTREGGTRTELRGSFDLFSTGNTASNRVNAPLRALLAPGECEPGDIPSPQLSRTVIHRDRDSVEAAVESHLAPTELTPSDLWFNADFSEWISPELLPPGHSRKKGIAPPSGVAASAPAKHDKIPKGSMNMLGLLTMLFSMLKPLTKRYVTGLRGELLEEGDEQLLGNTDVMVLPWTPLAPFDPEETSAAKKQDPKNRGKKERRRRKFQWRDTPQGFENSRDDGENTEEGFDYDNFDVFGFFNQLLAKNSPANVPKTPRSQEGRSEPTKNPALQITPSTSQP